MQTSTPPIALFIPSLRGGGAERAMLLFAQELLRRGYTVDLVVTQKSGPLAEIIPVGVTLFDLNQTRTIKALPGLVRYLRNRRPRALYSTIVHANVIAVIAGILARLKTPVIIRESNAPVSEPKATWSRWVTFKLVPWTYRWATGVIAVSEGVADELTAIDPQLAKTIKAIPTPVVSQELFDLAEEPLAHPWFQPGEPPVILAVARLQPHKGFVNLVRAFAQVRAERQARLVILGEGKEREVIQQEIFSLGL
jgi:glycosyltransferase involved in cell wall biosynthesis